MRPLGVAVVLLSAGLTPAWSAGSPSPAAPHVDGGAMANMPRASVPSLAILHTSGTDDTDGVVRTGNLQTRAAKTSGPFPPIPDNGIAEAPEEALTVALDTSRPVAVLGLSQTVAAPEVFFDWSDWGERSAREGETVIIPVHVEPAPVSPVTIRYTLGPDADVRTDDADSSDYTGSGSVEIAANQGDGIISIAIVDDPLIEPLQESFIVSLAAPTADSGYVLGEAEYRKVKRVIIAEGVCDRTPQVQDGIMRFVNSELNSKSLQRHNVSNCADVRSEHLTYQIAHPGIMDLARRGIRELKVGDFQDLPVILYFDLRDNQLETLPDGVFEGLVITQQLNLSGNSLRELSAGTFSGLEIPGAGDRGGTALFLRNNQLETLPSDVFSGLVIGDLDLSGNRLRTLPTGIFFGQDMRYGILNLKDNQLESLPIGAFTGLRVWRLDLRDNQLQTLPVFVFFDMVAGQLDLSGNKFTHLPSGLFSGLELRGGGPNSSSPGMLRMRDVAVRESLLAFQPGVFSGLKVDILDLSTANATPELLSAYAGFSAGVFDGLTVGTLDLSNNWFTAFPPGLFEGLDISGDLILGGNCLLTLAPNMFRGLIIDTLDLSYNALLEKTPAPPADLFNGLTVRKGLDLSLSGLSRLSADVFNGLTISGDLDLSLNELERLPADVFRGLGISGDLDLSRNRLMMLPENVFAGLVLSGDLKLSDNQLVSLPSDIFAGLEIGGALQLQGNKLVELPHDVFAGLRIDNLDIGINALSSLPARLFAGLNLENLRLDQNRLETLSVGAFADLRVDTLDLAGNALSALPAEAFAGLNVNENLVLSGNRLVSLPANVFAGLNLENLHLDQNRLETLSVDAFADLSVRGSLDLSINRLESLPAGVFSGLSLESLFLRNNVLSMLPGDFFSHFDVGRELGLDGNVGAPFQLAVELEHIAGDSTVDGSTEVRLQLSEGAPVDISVPLLVSGGTSSVSTATIVAKATASESFTIEGSGRITVGLGDLPALPGGYTGLQLVGGDPLVLFGLRPIDATITSNPENEQTYIAGEFIEVTLRFSEAVVVDATAGQPGLVLQMGAETRNAAYVSGTDMDTLLFRYQVLEGDVDVDGISWSQDALELNGGSLADRSGNAAVLTLPGQADTEFHKVVAPRLEVSFDADSYVAVECNAALAGDEVCDTAGATIQVRLNKVPVVPFSASLNYLPAGGASAGDYQAATFVLFQVGEMQKNLQVHALADLETESGEKVTVTFGGLSARATAVEPTTVEVQLLDLPTLNLSSSFSTGAEGSSVVVTVTSSVPAPVGGMEVGYMITAGGPDAATGADFTDPDDGMVTIPAGMQVADISIFLNDDAVYEGDESFAVELAVPAGITAGTFVLGAPSGTTVIIADNDEQPDAFTLAVAPPGVSESAGVTEVTVTIALVGEVSLAIATDFSLVLSGSAIEGTDYTLRGERLVRISAGALVGRAAFTLTPNRDLDVEGDERIVFTASSSSFTASQTVPLVLTNSVNTGFAGEKLTVADAKMFYHAFAVHAERGNDAVSSQASHALVALRAEQRDDNSIVSSRASAVDVSPDERLQRMLAVADALDEINPEAMDFNGDLDVNIVDAAVLYYALALPASLGNGVEGGYETLRRTILGRFLPGNPSDAELRAMLLRANSFPVRNYLK